MRTSRRRFIQKAGATGAFVVLVPLSGCGRDEGRGRGRDANAPDRNAAATDPCADLTALTPEERSFRDDAGYVAETPTPAERCDNCAHWEPPRAGESCGGCAVVVGPIHPGGYCDLWEAPSEE